jgi:hypothetical protein
VGRKRFLIPIGFGPRQFVSTSVKRTSGTDSFGFSLGSQNGTGDLYVTKVAGGTSRGASKLQVADIITHVGGNDVRAMEHDDAIDLIFRANTVVLGIQRVEGMGRKTTSRTATTATESVAIVKRRDNVGLRSCGLPKSTEELAATSVTISRDELDQSFGFGLASTVGGLKVVSSVAPHGLAVRILKVGDVIDTVDGIKLESFAHDSVLDLIGNALDLSLGLRRASSKMRRRKTDQPRDGSGKRAAVTTDPPLAFRKNTPASNTSPASNTAPELGVHARPRATTAPALSFPHPLPKPPRGFVGQGGPAHPSDGTGSRTNGLAALPEGTPVRLSAAEPTAEWAHVRFCRYCGASLRDMGEVDKITHLTSHPEFQRSGPKHSAGGSPQTGTPTAAPPSPRVSRPPAGLTPLMPSSSDRDAWWAGGYAKEYINEVVSHSSPGDFLLRDGVEGGTVLLVINDYGRAKQSMISLGLDGRCRISGIPDAFPSLTNLINLMRMKRQYSKVQPGQSFVLGMPAGNIFSSFNFKVWSLGQSWTE